MELVWPAREHLPSYLDALNRGWSPDNVRGDFARLEELHKIDVDADGFLAGLVDREAKGYRRWMWDGDFVGSIGSRWQPGASELPPHVLGHIGYAVVPWKRGHGYATQALRLLLPGAKAEGLTYVELTVEPTNRSSRHVIEANRGILVEEFVAPGAYSHKHLLRFRIDL